jgi:Ca2+-dependent lipid-binding protein
MSMQSDRSGGRPAGPTALPNDAVLYVSIHSARDLKRKQKIGVQDPYCAVYIVAKGKQQEDPTFKTSTHEDGGQSPVWNEKGTIIISDVASDVLRIKVMNENLIGR